MFPKMKSAEDGKALILEGLISVSALHLRVKNGPKRGCF
jgi:hypothetical protein